MGMPALMLVVVAGLWLQSAVALKARCLDAARAGARAAARGDAEPAVRAALAGALPPAAHVVISRGGGQVTVVVSTPANPPAGLAALLGAPTVTASATGSAEDAP